MKKERARINIHIYIYIYIYAHRKLVRAQHLLSLGAVHLAAPHILSRDALLSNIYTYICICICICIYIEREIEKERERGGVEMYVYTCVPQAGVSASFALARHSAPRHSAQPLAKRAVQVPALATGQRKRNIINRNLSTPG